MSDNICYKPKDVQEILNLSQTKTYELFHSEGFPKLQFGSALRVRKADFEKWLESQVKR